MVVEGGMAVVNGGMVMVFDGERVVWICGR